jgi:hypothetical protein
MFRYGARVSVVFCGAEAAFNVVHARQRLAFLGVQCKQQNDEFFAQARQNSQNSDATISRQMAARGWRPRVVLVPLEQGAKFPDTRTFGATFDAFGLGTRNYLDA